MDFNGIIGNEGVRERLARSVETGRQVHAYLFAGPGGVGKFQTALAFARAVMRPETGWAKWDPQGSDGVQAAAFVQAAEERRARTAASRAGKSRSKASASAAVVGEAEVSQRGPIHPDLEILRPIGPTRSITIDQVRGISLAASTRPVSAERKVFILDDADRLKVEAGNSILKVLEEPPEFMTIILVTSEPSRILPTIRSRCAVYNFRPLGEDELRNELIGKYGAEPGQAAFLARYTRGSIGQALTLLADAGFMERRYALMDKLMGAHAFTALEILGFCQEYGERKEGSTELLGLYRAFLRDIALIKAMGEAARSRVSNPDMYDDMRKASYDWPEGKAGKALRALGELEKAWAYTRGNLNFRLGLEACLFKGLAGVEVTGVFGPVANHGFMV